jgi:hypothetical protein
MCFVMFEAMGLLARAWLLLRRLHILLWHHVVVGVHLVSFAESAQRFSRRGWPLRIRLMWWREQLPLVAWNST